MEARQHNPQLLYENADFCLFLHCQSTTSEHSYALQVSLKQSCHGEYGRAEMPRPLCSASAEVICREDEQGSSPSKSPSDIFFEFRKPAEQAVLKIASRASRCQTETFAGCWYGCEEEDEQVDDVLELLMAEAAAGEMHLGSSSSTSNPEVHGAMNIMAIEQVASRADGDYSFCKDSIVPLSTGEVLQMQEGLGNLPETCCRGDDRGKHVTRLASWAWPGGEPDQATAIVPTEMPWSMAEPSEVEDQEPLQPASGEAVASSTVVEVCDDDPSTEGYAWYFGREVESVAIGSNHRKADGPQAELVRISSTKAEWRLRGITGKMNSYPKGSRIFSPEFEVFGIKPMGLVFYPNGNSNAKQGFCSLGLKAPHGTHLRYKLYIGGTERFTDLRHNVTESWGFVDMCKVEDELQADEDLLRLGVEIIDDIDSHESLKTVSSNKVEWIIGNMQNKMAHYPKDIALYSDEFSVGGVDKLRLKFYIAGKKEADAGWCSLYLEAPKGSELRCRLSVGKKSMSFDRLEKFGEDSIWGFLTVCRLQDELEQDGSSVCVGLEVMETKRLDGRLSESEDSYLKTLPLEKRTWLLGELDRVEKLRSSGDGSVPSRFRILQLDIPDQAKAVALAKLDTMHSDVLSGEGSKLKRWIDGLLSIPFGSSKKPLVSLEDGRHKVQEYLTKARRKLDDAVFGHEEPKQKIVQLLCQWIANPDSMSLVLGIQGPPGNGKTTLCRKGIAEALQRPFVQVSLGGATDASVLEGHSYTYVGSTWGRIAGLLMEAQCMNPVIFFDELDKVSGTPRGEEIVGVLTHLTDHSQNRTFSDRYFEGIPLDVSRALFIFSFNDESKLNPVLKDRLTLIHTDGFDMSAKIKISQDYLIPELLANVGMQAGDVTIERDELNYLCQRCGVSTEEGGVRGIKQSLESVILHLNEIRLTQEDKEAVTVEDEIERDANEGDAVDTNDVSAVDKTPKEKKQTKRSVKLPVALTNELIADLVTQKRKSDIPAMMYI